MEITGTLEKLATRDWNGKTLNNALIKGDDGSENWVGFGLEKPPMQPMSRVKVSVSRNAKGYLTAKAKDIELLKEQTVAAPVASGGGGKSGFQDRQASIVLQSSIKAGIEMANALLANGLFKPAANTKERKANAVEAYIALVDKLAVETYQKCMEPESFVDSYIAELSTASQNPGPNEDEGRPIEDDIPDF
jgi:hypothetical protein